MNNLQKIQLENKLQNQTTNNVLHLILSLLTIGLWLPIWALVGISNSIERRRIINKLGKLQ